jgi:hypothetical protein
MTLSRRIMGHVTAKLSPVMPVLTYGSPVLLTLF